MTLSKNKIKYIKSLHLKKFRQKYNNFIAEGDKIAREIIRQQDVAIEAVYATPTWIDTNDSALEAIRDKVFKISVTDLQRISTLKTANEVLVIAQQLDSKFEVVALKSQLSLYLDGIQDPGNLGTILRIADWFGISHVFCSEDTADLYNPKVIQATMGAFLRVKYIPHSLESLAAIPELNIMGTTLDGENAFEMKLPKQGVIVIGNEGQGIRAASKPYLDQTLRIPAFSEHGAESLNAAVATGIICALFRKG
jgi:TrmH family RNA methyltransferase